MRTMRRALLVVLLAAPVVAAPVPDNVTGAFSHRRPALEVLRQIVDERTFLAEARARMEH